MNEQITVTLTPLMLSIAPVVAAIIQILKQIPAIAKLTKWLPFGSIAVSYGACLLMNAPNPEVASIIIGLVASGGYDLFKKTTE